MHVKKIYATFFLYASESCYWKIYIYAMITNKITSLWVKNLYYFITPRLCVFFLLRMPSIFWHPFWLCEFHNQEIIAVKIH